MHFLTSLKSESRYLIIGCSGSGKSTLARAIAECMEIPYYDTDSLYWREGWELRSDEDVVQSLPLDSPNWVLDGNFVGMREEVWNRATCIILLDLPPAETIWNTTRRNLGWWIKRTPTWSGNVMPLRIALSGIKHSKQQTKRFAEDFPNYLTEHEDKQIFRIRKRSDLEKFMASLKQ
ncbi:(d)CMP kinase [Rubritalea squalenifaciens]|nr:(d)CMP kinase [Rubritalea squalenifaciens]